MKYIATVLLLLMAISLIFSGVLLWRRRKETGDYSRTIWAIFSWIPSFRPCSYAPLQLRTLSCTLRLEQEQCRHSGTFQLCRISPAIYGLEKFAEGNWNDSGRIH